MLSHKDKVAEHEESEESIDKKIKQLARLLTRSKSVLVYTGAGISTSADIPDYRGPNGVWTLASQNKTVDRTVDMVRANPTFTHMFLKELYKNGKVKHILSQNCDGLHLRSGLPHACLSEVHGNMYIEICNKCDPLKMYVRPFDCTRNSAFKKHKTERICDVCGHHLQDTIIHFGEKGSALWPLNWPGFNDANEEVDLIICIGSSLNVLKHYEFLWPDKISGVKLVIINLQWTAKDKHATIKIHGQSDTVMKKLSDAMKITPGPYCRRCDPVLSMNPTNATDLMRAVTDCSCGDPLLTCPEPEEAVASEDRFIFFNLHVWILQDSNQPGWWAAEIARMKASTPNAKAPSPEPQASGIFLRTRKAKQRGRKKKPKVETDFERDIRLAVIDLVNIAAGEPYASSRRGRGRPKKYYCLSIEKEGSFKMDENNGLAETKLVKEERPPDFDFSADDSSGSSCESDESHEGDPSFKMPKQMLARTFWCGPVRKKRGKSGESQDWDLLPKRTRKTTSTPTTPAQGDSKEDSPPVEEEEEAEENLDEMEEETVQSIEEVMTVYSADTEGTSSPEDSSIPDMTDSEGSPASSASAENAENASIQPTASSAPIVVNGHRHTNGLTNGYHYEPNTYNLPEELVNSLRSLLEANNNNLACVAPFMVQNKEHPALANLCINDLMDLGNTLIDTPAQNGYGIHYNPFGASNGTMSRNYGAHMNGFH